MKITQRNAMHLCLLRETGKAYGLRVRHRGSEIKTAYGSQVQGMVVTGVFGVHPAILGPNEIGKALGFPSIILDPEWWTITHLPTGMKIVDVSSGPLALACIKGLESLDWTPAKSGMPRLPKTSVINIIQQTCDRFNGGFRR